MKTVKRVARQILKKLPDEGRLVKSTLRSLKLKKDIALGELVRRVGGATLPEQYRVFWIDPARIRSHTNMRNPSADWEDWIFNQKQSLAPVQDGDWDQAARSVEEMRVFRAIADRIHGNEPWQSTDYYQYAIAQIAAGRNLWGCSDQASFDRHCSNVDALIESISKHGYLPSQDVPPCSSTDSGLGGFQEVLINIGRHGDSLFQDGRHRLAIARALGVSKIPVQVLVRHAKWQSFRELMHRMARGEGGASKSGVLYQAPIHFDLGDIPYEHACDDRWLALKANLVGNHGRALDIGCNLGFFCHQLEDEGYSCVGVEYLPDIAHAAQVIARAENRSTKIVTGDVLAPETLAQAGGSEFDLVIALNIFHHFIKTPDGYEKLRAFLGRLKAKSMFFEPHLPSEPQMVGVYANPQPAEFVELVRTWGGFSNAKAIYSADDGRTVYLLAREGESLQ